MSIFLVCDGCDKQYNVADELAGKPVACKACGHRMWVPEKSNAAAAPRPKLPSIAEFEVREPAAREIKAVPTAPTTISFKCQGCAKAYRVDENFAGKRVLCKACGSANVVPAAVAAPRAAASPRSAPLPVAPPPLPAAAMAPRPVQAPVPVRSLEYGQYVEPRDPYVEFPGEDLIVRFLPLLILLGFAAYVIESARELYQQASALSPSSPYASGYLSGYLVSRVAGQAFLVFAISGPLCALGVYTGSRIMKFDNRPNLYWRCAVTMMTPFALTLLLNGFNLNRAFSLPLALLALAGTVGVMWLMFPLRIGPFAVAGGFALLFSVVVPALLVVLLAFVVATAYRGRRAPLPLPAVATPPRVYTTPAGPPPKVPSFGPAYVPPMPRPAVGPFERSTVEAQLKRLHLQLMTYAATHAGAYPRALSLLHAADPTGPDETVPAHGGIWVYSTHNLTRPFPPIMILAHDTITTDGQRTCLFGDGHVETVSMTDWPTRLNASGAAARAARDAH